MSAEIKKIIKKYAGALWLVIVLLTYGIVYIICNVCMNLCGVPYELGKNITVDVSSVSSIIMYIWIAIWGVKNL